MTVPRSKLIDLSVTRWYHITSRCVRKAFLLSDSLDSEFRQRKDWIERRIRELANIFSISVGGYALMDNHFHLLLRVDTEIVEGWSAIEVAKRWCMLYPPKTPSRKPFSVEQLANFITEMSQNAEWIALRRERLSSISWFMKCLKEPLSRMANRADKCTGAFFEGRFKSIAILDEESLLSVCAYIDLNPVAAGLAMTPEASEHTSLRTRVAHLQHHGFRDIAKAVAEGTCSASKSLGKIEDSIWLIPIEDRRRIDSIREGFMETFTIGNYLAIVEYTGRLYRDGKARISVEVAGILERLGCSQERWQTRLRLLSSGRNQGRFLASSKERLQQAAQKLGFHRLVNLNGCPA